jgi:molybdopterin converting factor small subunit
METQMTLKLFGALRKYGENSTLNVSLPEFCLVSDLKVQLSKHLEATYPGFTDSGLLAECAFATEDRVLAPHEAIPQTSFLAVLPPVCGG